MKILIVSHTYIAPINRDKWKTLAQLYPNDDLTVIFPAVWPTHLFTHNTTSEHKDDLANCKFIAMDAVRAGNEVLYGYRFAQLYRLLKHIRPNIIQVEQGDNAFSYFQVIFLAKLLRLNAKILFFTWVNWQARFSLKYRLTWRWIEKINLAASSGALTGNNDAKHILQTKKFKKPILILPQLGVNQEIFKPTHHATSAKTIGYLGRLVPEKGILLLLQAFNELIKTFPEWRLLIVGRGPEQKELEQFVHQNNLGMAVSFQPPVSHYEIATLINQLSILVLPSYDTPDWKEQFGHILIEAMACSIPVIGSSAGEIPNVIQDAGLIFEQKNLQSLLASLQTLMQDEEQRKTIGKKGLERVNKHYSHHAIAQATHAFWQSLL